jgi:hypothetical protein
VGFNPMRRYRGAKTVDIAILVVGFVVLAGLIVWAMR